MNHLGRLALAIPLLLPPATAQIPDLDSLKQTAAELADSRRKLTQEICDSIFSFAELGYQEFETSRYVTAILEKEGFKVTRGVAGMPTAFVAEWGSGKPVIGLMADIDALPETSQKPGIPWYDPLIKDGPGHGEGHNSGQAVAVTAAVVAKQIMQRYHIPGTIRVYPGVAEEQLGSRTYMVREGLFRDLDVMLSSHVSNTFATSYGEVGSGLVSTVYTFHGRSAHAAAGPWQGRSALDAVELMNAGWNYRREHLRLEQRSHYVIVNGGSQPNVVPSLASVWYYFREIDYPHIKELHEIGTRIAHAAAEMTDTTMTERVLAATWPGHFNRPLAAALHANIEKVGMPRWSADDQVLARAAQKEMGRAENGLATKVTPFSKRGEEAGTERRTPGGASDDIAEVSWNVPTVVLRYPANIPGMIGHHWSSGIAMATPIAHQGSTAGAKAHAMTILDLLRKPELLKAAKDYFAEQTKTIKWQSLIPEGTLPPVELNADKMEKARPQLEKLRYDPARYATYLQQLGIKYPTIQK